MRPAPARRGESSLTSLRYFTPFSSIRTDLLCSAPSAMLMLTSPPSLPLSISLSNCRVTLLIRSFAGKADNLPIYYRAHLGEEVQVPGQRLHATKGYDGVEEERGRESPLNSSRWPINKPYLMGCRARSCVEVMLITEHIRGFGPRVQLCRYSFAVAQVRSLGKCRSYES